MVVEHIGPRSHLSHCAYSCHSSGVVIVAEFGDMSCENEDFVGSSSGTVLAQIPQMENGSPPVNDSRRYEPSRFTQWSPTPSGEIFRGEEFHGEDPIPTASTVVPTRLDMSMNAPSIEMNDYKQEIVVINIELIMEPEDPTRPLKPGHIDSMEHILENQMYQISAGSLCICAKEVWREGDVVEEAGRKVIKGKAWLIDGRHRKRALEQLARKDGGWCYNVKSLPVTLWSRLDSAEMSLLEVVSIGSMLNMTTSNVLPTSFTDNVHTAISLARLMSKSRSIELDVMESTALAGALLRMKAIGNLKIRQLQRYAQVALVLATSKRMFDGFFECNERLDKQGIQLGLEHVNNGMLLGMDVNGFLFCLRVLSYRLEAHIPGSFSDIRRKFYLCAKLHYLTL